MGNVASPIARNLMASSSNWSMKTGNLFFLHFSLRSVFIRISIVCEQTDERWPASFFYSFRTRKHRDGEFEETHTFKALKIRGFRMHENPTISYIWQTLKSTSRSGSKYGESLSPSNVSINISSILVLSDWQFVTWQCRLFDFPGGEIKANLSLQK